MALLGVRILSSVAAEEVPFCGAFGGSTPSFRGAFEGSLLLLALSFTPELVATSLREHCAQFPMANTMLNITGLVTSKIIVESPAIAGLFAVIIC